MRVIFILNLITLWTAVSLSGCSIIQSLRREVEDDGDYREPVAEIDYADPRNRYNPPPPANVSDSRLAALNGTSVDLSGVRAKNLRVKAQDFIAENGKNENSLWSEEGQNNYLFAANKLKAPGDLVTVVIEDQLRKDMVDSVKKVLPPEYRDQEIRVPGLTKEMKGTGEEQGGRAIAGEKPKGEGEFDYTDVMTAEVLERYPNGNVRIRGIKRVPFKRQVRNIEIVAIVRGIDISEKDQVKSSRFFEQRVELYR